MKTLYSHLLRRRQGETTAAAGLAARMAGYGRNVLFVQFFKGGETGEVNLFSALPQFHVLRCEKASLYLSDE